MRIFGLFLLISMFTYFVSFKRLEAFPDKVPKKLPQRSCKISTWDNEGSWDMKMLLSWHIDSQDKAGSLQLTSKLPIVCDEPPLLDKLFPKIKIGQTMLIAKKGQHFIRISAYPKAELCVGAIKGYCGKTWPLLVGQKYFLASTYFSVEEVMSDDVRVGIVWDEGMKSAKLHYEGKFQNKFSGSLQLALPCSHPTAMGRASVGGFNSQDEAGDGFVDGNWHTPKSRGRYTCSRVTIDRCKFEKLPFDAFWAFEAEFEPPE